MLLPFFGQFSGDDGQLVERLVSLGAQDL